MTTKSKESKSLPEPKPVPEMSEAIDDCPFEVVETRKATFSTQTKEELQRQKERDYKKVTGVFKVLQDKIQSFSFYFKKYKNDLRFYTLTNGKKYTLDLMVAEHLRDNCFRQNDITKFTLEGKPYRVKGPKVPRFSFDIAFE